MAIPTELPSLIKNPLPNRSEGATITPSQGDNQKLWEAVQRLQATVNQLIMYIDEQDNP